MSASIKHYLPLTLYAVFLVVLILAGYGWVSDHFEKSTNPQTSSDLTLKAKPQDIIHSEAYTNKEGKNEVKYAYLTTEVPPTEGEDISLRTPESQTTVLGNHTDETGKQIKELKTTFLSKPQFYKQSDGTWRHLEYATTTEETFAMSGAIPNIKKREFFERLTGAKPLYAATATYYPNPNAESTSVDGYIQSASSDGSYATAWTNARDVAYATGSDDSSPVSCILSSASYDFDTSQYAVSIWRGIFLFDTSSLTGGSSISNAVLSFYIYAKVNTGNDSVDTINVVESSPASNTSLVNGDFDDVGSTLQASAIDITGISTGVYTDFTLDGTGIGNVSKTGVSKFGLREGHDLGDSALTPDTEDYVCIYTADQTGTSQDPKLVVTYTVSSFSMGQWFPF